jgi:bacillithiol biosynthesis cysteine-adding enzyme BshC
MASIRFRVKEFDYAAHPWFGETSFLSRLKSGDMDNAVQILSRQHINHSSHSEFLDRQQLSMVLKRYNELVGNPLKDSTIRMIQTDGRFILTGHQPVLLTGPLFTFLKVVSVLSLSRNLEQHSETPLIPGIWVATEDHDVLEVNRCVINGRQFVCNYEGKIETDRMAQGGDINLKECREPLLKFLNETLPHNDFYEWILDIVSSCRFENYGQMFASLLQRIFKDWPIVFIDPIALRPVSAPALASIVEQWADIEKVFEDGKKMLSDHGFTPPLSALNIYEIVDGKRMKCRLTNQSMAPSTGVKDFSSAAADIRARPMAFSSGAALRPLVQDGVIPVMVYIGGPAELLYSWQITPLYDVAGITRSKLLPRISATFLENKIKKAALRSGLYPEHIFNVHDILKNYTPDTRNLKDIEEIDGPVQQLLNCIERLKTKKNKKWVDKSKDAIRHHLDKLRNRLAEEKLRETGSGRKNLEKVANAVMPTGKLQERVINIFQFLSFYGPDFISLSIESLDPEKLCHQVVEIEPSS